MIAQANMDPNDPSPFMTSIPTDQGVNYGPDGEVIDQFSASSPRWSKPKSL